jgi:hypothetical protein
MRYRITNPKLKLAVRKSFTPEESSEKFGNVSFEEKMRSSREFLKSIGLHDMKPLINLKRKNA